MSVQFQPTATDLTFLFPEPVVPLGTGTWRGTLEPELEGEWSWLDPRTLSFVPRPAFAVGTTYQVDLGELGRFAFTTPDPEIREKSPREQADSLQEAVYFRFVSQPWGARLEIWDDETPVETETCQVDPNPCWKELHTLAVRAREPLQRDHAYTARLYYGDRLACEHPFRTYGKLVQHAPQVRTIHTNCFAINGEVTVTVAYSNPLADKPKFEVQWETADGWLPLAPQEVYLLGRGFRFQLPQRRGRHRALVQATDVHGESLMSELEFEVAARRPWWMVRDQLITVDCLCPIFPLPVMGLPELHLEWFTVAADEFPSFAKSRSSHSSPPFVGDGPPVVDTVLLPGPLDEVQLARLSAARVAQGKPGHFILNVSAGGVPQWTYWVQVVDRTLVTFRSEEKTLLWSAALQDGEALGGGTGVIPKPGREYQHLMDGVWTHHACSTPHEHSFAHAETDRGLYRPGEEVAVYGWALNRNLQPWAQRELRYDVWANNEKVLEGQVTRTDLGGFAFRFPLPKQAQVGDYSVRVEGREWCECAVASFICGEYRRPDLEVTVEVDLPHVSMRARDFAGGPAVGAEVEWTGTAVGYSGRLPRHPRFFYGYFEPRWFSWMGPATLAECRAQGQTDGQGRHQLELPLELPPGTPVKLAVEAQVVDVSRQRCCNQQRQIVHPSPLRVGVCVRSYLALPMKLELLVTDERGVPQEGHVVELGLEGQEPIRQVLSRNQPVALELDLPEHGWGRVYARIAGHSCTSFPFYGGDVQLEKPNSRELRLVPVQGDLQPGDVATVILTSPVYPAQGMYAVCNDGLLDWQRFEVTAPTQQLAIPICEAFYPCTTLLVEVVGQRCFARGSLKLEVQPLARQLRVELEHPDKVRPGANVTVSVTVHNAAGAAEAGADVVLLAVDAAVLQVARREYQDPAVDLYRERWTGVWLGNLLERIIPPDVERDDYLRRLRKQDLDGKSQCVVRSGRPDAPIPLRTDFSPLACFEMGKTDERGRVTVSVSLPDTLTRYRICAIVVGAGTKTGIAEGDLVASLPVLMRAHLPRFLRPGDRCRFGVILENPQAHALPIALAWGERSEQRVLSPGQRVVVDAEADAEQLPLRVQLTSSEHEDALEVDVPVLDARTFGVFLFATSLHNQRHSWPLSVPGELELRFHSLPPLSAWLRRLPPLLAGQTESTVDLASRLLMRLALGARGVASLRAFLLDRIGREREPFALLHGWHALLEAERAGHAAVEVPKLPRHAYAHWLLATYRQKSVGCPEPATVEELAWMMMAVPDQRPRLHQQAMQKADRTPAGLSFRSMRADALMLSAWLALEAPDPNLEPLARQLWQQEGGDPQDLAFALLALSEYGRRFQAEGNSEVQVWLDDEPLVARRVTIERPCQLTVEHRGSGRTFLDMALLSEVRPPHSAGFQVTRTYAGEGVLQQADGTWVFPAGCEVEATVRVRSEGRREGVWMVAPLPACAERDGDYEHGSPNRGGSREGGLPPPPYDDRVERYSWRQWGGEQSYRYRFHAVHCGVYTVPPARVECLDQPEVMGCGPVERVEVRPPGALDGLLSSG